MKQLVFAFIVLAVVSLTAETIVPAGPVQGVWEQTGSPYRVMGNLSITEGSSLLINEGVEVIFGGTFRIDVTGRILATGTPASPVTITAQDTLNGWSGIRFSNCGGMGNPPSGFTHTNFSYGKAMWGSGGADPLNYGGAIWASNAGTLTFNDCNFFRCVSAQDGSAIFAKDNTSIVINGGSIKSCDSGFFGGVYVKDGNAVITGCSFFYNTAVTFGAAIYFYSCAQAKVISCRIQDNVSGAVTGIYSYDSPLMVINSLFATNSTTMGLGGGIGAIFGTLTVNNCSFAYNSSAQGGAAIWMNSLTSPAQITNTLFWGNTPVALTTTSSTYSLHYCSTQSEEGDATNIFGDPIFVNGGEGDYRLDATSPCIDAGTPDVTGLMLPDTDLDGLDRLADGDSDGVPRIDIGCYEWQVPVSDGTLEGVVTDNDLVPVSGVTITVGGNTTQTDQAGYFSMILPAGMYTINCSAAGYQDYAMDNVEIIAGQTTTVSIQMSLVSGLEDDLTPSLPLLTASPNPFHQHTELRWDLKNPISLDIFNLRGQLVRSYCPNITDSTGSYIWDGFDQQQSLLPSGIYLCRLRTTNTSVTIKLLLRK